MEDEGRLVAQLTRLGLTSYEAKAYLALIRRDSFTAAQVARQSGVPRQRIYDVLGGMVHKGLAVARPGTVVKYAATSPDMAIGRLVEAHREALGEMEREARTMADSLRPAFEAGQELSDPLEYIEVLRDRRAIAERLVELGAGVRHEILAFAKEPYPAPLDEAGGPSRPPGHIARTVYERRVLEDPAAMAGVRQLIERGQEVRVVPEVPLRMVVVDESVVMFGMEDPLAGGSDLTMVVVEHSSLAKVLRTAFDTVWGNAQPLDDQAAARASA